MNTPATPLEFATTEELFAELYRRHTALIVAGQSLMNEKVIFADTYGDAVLVQGFGAYMAEDLRRRIARGKK